MNRTFGRVGRESRSTHLGIMLDIVSKVLNPVDTAATTSGLSVLLGKERCRERLVLEETLVLPGRRRPHLDYRKSPGRRESAMVKVLGRGACGDSRSRSFVGGVLPK